MTFQRHGCKVAGQRDTDHQQNLPFAPQIDNMLIDSK